MDLGREGVEDVPQLLVVSMVVVIATGLFIFYTATAISVSRETRNVAQYEDMAHSFVCSIYNDQRLTCGEPGKYDLVDLLGGGFGVEKFYPPSKMGFDYNITFVDTSPYPDHFSTVYFSTAHPAKNRVYGETVPVTVVCDGGEVHTSYMVVVIW